MTKRQKVNYTKYINNNISFLGHKKMPWYYALCQENIQVNTWNNESLIFYDEETKYCIKYSVLWTLTKITKDTRKHNLK